MPNRFGRVVTPVFRQVADVFEHFGSGVLVKGPTLFWLFTAEHVVKPPCVIWLPAKPRMLPVHEIRRSPDPLDLAYAQLAPEMATGLMANGLAFLPLDKIDPSPGSFYPGTCIFAGYPVTDVKIDFAGHRIAARGTVIRSSFLSDDQLSRRRFNPRLHLAAKVDRLVDQSGGRFTGFSPFGISGGALWRSVAANDIKLVGIATEYRQKKRVISGTRIGPMLAEIARRLT